MNRKHPLEVIRRAAGQFDAALVSFSCGKDSLAVLDLCCAHFKRVEAFHMFITPGLSFHEAAIARAEKRYPGLVIHRLPHWILSRLLRSASLRNPSPMTVNLPRLSLSDCEDAARKITGIEWIAGGHKRHDSLERVAMLNKCNSIDPKTKRFYPIAYWSNAGVLNHLKRQRISLPSDYAIMGHSYGGDLYADSLLPIRRHFPDDFEKIAERFPDVRADLKRCEWIGTDKFPTSRGWGRWFDDIGDYREAEQISGVPGPAD